jgi:hypothetical protein
VRGKKAFINSIGGLGFAMPAILRRISPLFIADSALFGNSDDQTGIIGNHQKE